MIQPYRDSTPDDALRADLGRFGEVLEVTRLGTDAQVRFATHAQAESAVAALQRGLALARAVAPRPARTDLAP